MNLEDLGRRAVACKHWRWMPGMLASDPGGNTHRVIWHDEGEKYAQTVLRDYDDAHVESSVPVDGVIPDLSDPATLGCLLHLVREATGEQSSPSWYPGGKHDYPHWAWYSDNCYGKLCEGATEAECLVRVLEAAP